MSPESAFYSIWRTAFPQSDGSFPHGRLRVHRHQGPSCRNERPRTSPELRIWPTGWRSWIDADPTFHRHWQALQNGDHLPSRSDIEPADIKHLLPHILLVDIEAEPFRVRYRVCGTRVAEMCGDVTGRYLDELDGGSIWSPALFQQQYKAACERRAPIFGRTWILTRFETSHPCLIGIWPLTKNGQGVDMCIAIEDYLELRADQL